MRAAVVAGCVIALLCSASAWAVTKLAAAPDVAEALTHKAADPPASSMVDQVTGFASHLPEPADWVLMIVGFGGAGGALRLRRRQQTPR